MFINCTGKVKNLSIWSCSYNFYTCNEAAIPLSYQNQVTYLHSPGIKYKGCFQHHRTWKRHLNYADSGTDVKIGTTMLQESIAYIFSSITLSHWRTKQSGLFTDPCSKHPPILVMKIIQWIIWWSSWFLRRAVDVCCNVSEEQAASLFRVIESGSGGCWSGWEETNMLVTWDIWRKSGQTEV
jgi:hypothetical protein